MMSFPTPFKLLGFTLLLWWAMGELPLSSHPASSTTASSPVPVVSPSLPSSSLPSGDILAEALHLIDTVYWRPEEVSRARLFISGVQRLETLGEDVLVMQPDVDGRMEVRAGTEIASFSTLGIDSSTVLAARLREVATFVNAHRQVVEEGPRGRDMEVELLRGLLLPLDRHCKVIDSRQKVDFDARHRGTLSGIGARVGKDQGKLVVKLAYPDSPGAKAGLRTGDHITHVDGVSTAELSVDAAVERMRGQEGTVVVLTVLRPPEIHPRVFSIQRAQVPVPSISSRLLEGRVGWIHIDHFSNRSSSEFSSHFRSLEEDAKGLGGLMGLVVDLRGNKGGSLLHSARIVDLLVREGTIVSTQGASGGPVSDLVERIAASPQNDLPSLPLVALTDSVTASGAEIVAGGIKFLGRGVLVGEQTFGKGTVQKVYTLRDDVELKITVARYRLGGEVWADTVGITPDIAVGKVTSGGETGQLRFPDRLPLRPHPEPGRPRAPSGPWEPSTQPPNDQPLFQGMVWEVDSGEDAVLELGRTLVASAPGAFSRGLLLEAVPPVLNAFSSRAMTRLGDALVQAGIPWTVGPSRFSDRSPATQEAARKALQTPPPPQLEVRLSLPEGGLRAGERGEVRLQTTHRGGRALPRLRAVLASDLEVLEGRQVILGDLLPGQTVERILSLTPSPRASEQRADVRIYFVSDGVLLGGAIREPVILLGSPGPRFSLRWALARQKSTEGSIRLSLPLEVRNDGEGDSSTLEVRLENPQMAGVELVTPKGTCPPLGRGVSASVTLTLDLPETLSQTFPLSFVVTDREKGVTARRTVDIDPRHPAPLSPWLGAPEILLASSQPLPLSGPTPFSLEMVLRDEDGLQRVTASLEGDRVWTRTFAGKEKEVPVRAPLPLAPGRNLVRIEARDLRGTRSEKTMWVWGEGGTPAILPADGEGTEGVDE